MTSTRSTPSSAQVLLLPSTYSTTIEPGPLSGAQARQPNATASESSETPVRGWIRARMMRCPSYSPRGSNANFVESLAKGARDPMDVFGGGVSHRTRDPGASCCPEGQEPTMRFAIVASITVLTAIWAAPARVDAAEP